MSSFKSDDFTELLPVYYKRLFPFDLFCSWLSYGSDNFSLLSHREMSFTLPGDIYIRYQSFDSPQDFEQEVIKKCPEKIDIGAVYNIKPRQKRMNSNFEVEEKELIFDIDMTDYDNVRTCCSEAEVCNKCWKLLVVATKILDAALRDDFGFEHLLWVFSGRRGVHCWVCDESARKLEPKVRADIAEYLQLLSKEDENGKLARIPPGSMHPSIRRAVNIIKEDFETMCVIEQDMLGTPENVKKVVAMLGDTALRNEVQVVWEKQSLVSSIDRWHALVKIYQNMHSKNLLKRSKYLIEELMLHFAYPRLDIEVSKGSNHLLKAPFCIHPKTGKVCVPFNPSSAKKFNPQTVPTISTLVDEIQNFDTKDAEKAIEMERSTVGNRQKTSMYKGVQVFKEFLRKLVESFDNKKGKAEGMEF